MPSEPRGITSPLLLAASAALILRAGGGALAQQGGPEDLARGPFIQLGGPTSMTVVWRTAAPSLGSVEYGTAPALGAVAAAPGEPELEHAVTIDGLQPATLYHFRARSGVLAISEVFTFRTFPPAGDPAPFRAAVWGDSGAGNDAQLQVAARLLALEPDLALHTGDIVYPDGRAEGFDPLYFSIYRDLIARTCVFTTLGNHDSRTRLGQPYLDAFHLPANNPAGTERYYSFDRGNVHFIVLDTNHPFGAGSPQHEWLASDLATAGGFWTVVSHHHTPYTTSEIHADDDINGVIREHLVPLYDLHGVDLVLVGHSHAYERTFPIRAEEAVSTRQDPHYLDPGGAIYITTGGGGRSLYDRDRNHPNNRYLAVYRKEYHATAIDFAGESLTIRAIRAGGQEIDAATLRKTPDVEAPAISGLRAEDVLDFQARIVWETDELADSRVEFGLTTALDRAAQDRRRTRSHSVELGGLLPGNEYFFRVTSKDRSGNASAADGGSFITPGARCVPDLESVLPDHGALAGGQAVTIRGSDLLPPPRIFFGGEEVEVLDPIDPSAITVLTPAAAAAGKVTVVVQRAGSCSLLVDGFDYRAPPEVRSLDPSWSRDGGRVEIRGERFAPESRAFIGGLELSEVEVLGPTALAGALGPCALQAVPGPYDVRVENLFGAGTLADAFDCSPPFLRGDCDGSGTLEITDAVFLLYLLLAGGDPPPCADACDANDSGELAIDDAITLLQNLFLGEMPLPPFPLPGFDLTADDLGCGA